MGPKKKQNLIFNAEGMDFDDILKNKELKKQFSVGGIYLISVKLDAYNKYIKIGMSKTNMISRISSHRTTLYPVHEFLKVHCMAMKPQNSNPQDQDIRDLKATFVRKAEKHIKDYLNNLKNQPPVHGEWYQVAVPRLIEIMSMYHFGDKSQNIPADGYNCKFYVFSPETCTPISKTQWNATKPEPIKTSSRINGRVVEHVSLP